MLIVSRLSVLIFALFAGVWSIILIKIGIDINWLFFVIGLLVASVFPPISFLLTWNAVPKARLNSILALDRQVQAVREPCLEAGIEQLPLLSNDPCWWRNHDPLRQPIRHHAGIRAA